MYHQHCVTLSLLLALITVGCQAPQSADRTPLVVATGAPIDAPPKSTPPASGPTGLKVAPTDPTERAALAQDAPKPVSREGYHSVSFAQLSGFSYQTDERGRLRPGSSLPNEIAALDRTEVAVSGYLVPIEFQEDKVSSLILVRNQLLCCYGEEPKLNEWIFINVTPPVEAVTDVPVTLFGRFYASPDKEEEQIISLYRMEATKMELMQ